MKYTPLKLHSSFSLLKSTNLPEPISIRLKEIGSNSAVLTDYNSLSGIPSFAKTLGESCLTCGYIPEKHEGNKGKCLVAGSNCNEYIKSDRKSIFGQKILISEDPLNHELSTSNLHLIAKNLQGWKNLMKISSESNKKEFFDFSKEVPKTSLELILKNKEGLVIYSGGPRSSLADFIITNPMAYHAKTYDEAKSFIKDKSFLKKELLQLAGKYKEVLGDSFFLAIQLIDKKSQPINEVLANIFRWVGKELNIKCIGVPDPHYAKKEMAADHRIILCNQLETTINFAAEKVYEKNEDLAKFFKSNNYYIPDYQEMIEVGHSEEELKNTLLVDEMCEKYSIFGPPRLPIFECPNNKKPEEYLRELCIEGWKGKLANIVKDEKNRKIYGDRLKEELNILCGAGLAPYFLIVADYIKYAREKLNCPNDPGRGSVGGCLVSHTIGITDCDPILYDLSFSRFYNSGRNDPTTGKFAMPDIDSDFPPSAREPIIKYITNKFGDDKVGHMATFSEYKGREALTAVFYGHGWGTFADRKKITAMIAQKDKITDDLQEMLEETGEASIIQWSIENVKELSEYCQVLDDGTLEGPLAKYFDQAMRLEGVKKNQGKHPSGIIISPVTISDICPLIMDKNSGDLITSFDMYAAEPTGLLKFDILGTNVNQKMVDACKFAKYGKVI